MNFPYITSEKEKCGSDKNYQQSITNIQFCYNIKNLEFQQSQRVRGGVFTGKLVSRLVTVFIAALYNNKYLFVITDR